MWFGEKLVVEVQARCISDWTPEIPGTEGPPETTVNPPWIRPIPAPDAPLNVRHDNGGTSRPCPLGCRYLPDKHHGELQPAA